MPNTEHSRLIALLEELSVREFSAKTNDEFRVTPVASFNFISRQLEARTLRPYQTAHALRVLDYLRHYGDRRVLLTHLVKASADGRRIVRTTALQMLIKTRYRSEKWDWDPTPGQVAEIDSAVRQALGMGVYGDTKKLADFYLSGDYLRAND